MLMYVSAKWFAVIGWDVGLFKNFLDVPAFWPLFGLGAYVHVA